MRTFKGAQTATLAASLLLVLAGCAETSAGSGDENSVKILIAGVFTGENPYPEGRTVAEAFVKRENDAGGVNGHTIEATYCDDKRDSNAAAQCARQAVSEEVAAYVSFQNNFSDVVVPVLESAKIPMLKSVPTNPMDFSSPNSWTFLSGAISYGAASGVVMAEDKCQTPAAVGTEAASSQFLMKAIGIGLKSAGGVKMLPPITTPVGTPDFAPTVASLRSKGVDCLGLAIPPADSLKVGQSIASTGADIKIYAAAGVINQDVIDQLDGSVEILHVSDFPDLSSDDPELKQFHADTKAAGEEPEPYGANAWWTMEAFRQLLEDIDGPVTAETLTATLKKTTDIELPRTPKVDLTKPFDVPGYERLFNRSIHVADVEGTKLKERPELADVTEFYRLLSKEGL